MLFNPRITYQYFSTRDPLIINDKYFTHFLIKENHFQYLLRSHIKATFERWARHKLCHYSSDKVSGMWGRGMINYCDASSVSS